MRYIFFVLVSILVMSCESSKVKYIDFADNKVIAHRGAWKTQNLPENSIAALRQAIALNCTGSEFDVRMTADNVLIVTHDADYNNLKIENSTYEELAKLKLSNGETLPKLSDFLKAGMKNNDSTGLVLEIKPSSIAGRNIKITNKVLDLVKELNAGSHISYYISFSYEILKHIAKVNPTAKTLYLDGSKAPQSLKNDSITGLDYLVYKLKKKGNWIKEAQELGLVLNAWTADKTEDIDWLIANNFDYITTNEPELVFKRQKASPTNDSYKLVWSDEFNDDGKPDPLKWDHEIGFKRNQEKQYYTDSLKNSRIEDGYLILESHKEKIKNAAFESKDVKNWRTNQPFANYTASSLTTKNLAEWTYGRIDIKAKLPEGVGLWPAFWMLGANYSEVGWPECGEIDIMEHVGFNPDSIFGTIHTKSYNHMRGTQKGKTTYVEKPYDTFHIYSLVWTPEYMDFILDGNVYNHIENEHKTTQEWPFDQDFHLKINVAIGGMLGGRKGIDDESFPNKMIIDYVRVYQKEN
ncbi:glycerophosphodiester phosphodiesterase family protein [Psychroserpens sp. Hel_I_66]|uniref:glycerophosphodiester phosphodiesterase family protein n=1 Tax=Psychroserpens sp. Hel_I_66 TaxID=1250004 RepID=UPI0006455DFB|nr:family 16 glycosylhydrolase [Psychroserpens sp. Hel_I_66]